MSDNKSNQKLDEKSRDPDLVNAGIALKRAADRAREIARQTGTCVVVYVNGEIREVSN